MLTALLLIPVLTFSPAPTLSEQNSPLKAPPGWKTEQQDKATILTPGDVPEGKFYVVMVTMKEGKAGTLDELLGEGKQMAAEIGAFKPANEPKPLQSEGGWDYQFVLGALEKSDRMMAAQIMAIRKGEQGGVVVVLSDSVETMSQYADAFAKMVREMGGAKAAPTLGGGKVDLRYAVPAGWAEQRANEFPLLVKEKHDDYNNYRMSLLVLPTETFTSPLRDAFLTCWNTYILPNYTSNIAPLPLMVRLKSGAACAFDADSKAVLKNGAEVTVALYLVAQGDRYTPIIGTYSGAEWGFDKTAESDIAQLLDTAQIPGAASARVALFDASGIAGEWKESGTSFANYITRGGAYAGDATISTATYVTLGSDGSYSRAMLAVGAAGNIREKDSGTWTVEDDELVLSKGFRYSLLGYGADPKVGRFLVLGNYANQKARLKFTNPRGPLQAMWMKAN